MGVMYHPSPEEFLFRSGQKFRVQRAVDTPLSFIVTEPDSESVYGTRPAWHPLFVIVTRFNMMSDKFRTLAKTRTLDQVVEWLRLRTPIFEGICLPSVLAQTQRPDAWLLGFDASLEEAVQPLLDRLSDHGFIRPAWQQVINGRHQGVTKTFVQPIRAMLTNAHTHIVTCRLDNDDALNLSFIKRTHDLAQKVVETGRTEEDFWISFPLGARANHEDCHAMSYLSNPFLSRVESVQGTGIRTALGEAHQKVAQTHRVYVDLTPEPMWLQYVHGQNLMNEIDEKQLRLASLHQIAARFGLEPGFVAPDPVVDARPGVVDAR